MKKFKQFLFEDKEGPAPASNSEESPATLYNREPPPIYSYQYMAPPTWLNQSDFDYNGDGILDADEFEAWAEWMDEYWDDLSTYQEWQRDPTMSDPSFNWNNPKHMEYLRRWKEEQDRRQMGQEREAGTTAPPGVDEEVWDEFLKYLRRLLGGDFEFERLTNDELMRFLRDYIRSQQRNTQ